MAERPEAVLVDTEMSSTENLDATVEHLTRFEYDNHDLCYAVFHTVTTDSDEPFAKAVALLEDRLVV